MTNTNLKAYVRFDGSGRIVPSSLILQRSKPKDGNWKQINSKECCLNNECSAPVYGADYIIEDVIPSGDGEIFYIATNPFENYTLQIRFATCSGVTLGEIATVGPDTNYEYAWFVSGAVLDEACFLQVRHVCGPDFYSAWNNTGG